MVLKGIVVVPWWSATSGSIVGVVIEPLVLELPGQTNAVLHLVFGVLVKRARAVEDLLVLFVVVALSVRLTDGGDHLVMILEGIVVVPRWSATSDAVIIVVVWLFGLEFLSQAKAVLHLMSAVLLERTRAIENLLVLLIVVALGARFIDGGGDVVWPAATILTRLRSF